jgi:hypothetical protein
MVLVVVEILDNSVSRVVVVVQIHSLRRIGVVVFGRRKMCERPEFLELRLVVEEVNS